MNAHRSTALCATAHRCGIANIRQIHRLLPGLDRVEQIQVIGSHNSYHVGIAPSESKLLHEKNLKLYQAFEYRHRPLDEQLNSGIRQIELDIYADSTGSHYAHPAGPAAVAAAGLPADPAFDPQGIMSKPGFKVMPHSPATSTTAAAVSRSSDVTAADRPHMVKGAPEAQCLSTF